MESRSVHDFQQCSCGSIFVDGGLDHQKHPISQYFEDLSEWEEE